MVEALELNLLFKEACSFFKKGHQFRCFWMSVYSNKDENIQNSFIIECLWVTGFEYLIGLITLPCVSVVFI